MNSRSSRAALAAALLCLIGLDRPARPAASEALVGLADAPCPELPARPAELDARTELELKPEMPDPDALAKPMGAATQAYFAALDAQHKGDWAALCRFQADDAAAARGPAVRAVFLGDSITENWRLADPAFFQGGVVNRGISGQTSPQMLVRFYADVVALHPRVVHILAGTNDLAGNTGPTSALQFENNIAAMCDIAQVNGIRVILGSIPPAASFPWRPGLHPGPQIIELNAWLRRYAARRGLTYVDYFAALADAKGAMRADLSHDGVHPHRAGYALMKPLAEHAIAAATAPVSLAWSVEAGTPQMANLRQMYDGTMLPGVEVATFSNADTLQPIRVVHRGESPQPLPKRSAPFPPVHFEVGGHRLDLYDYLATNRVAGLLVLKDGQIAFEDYELGIGPETHWISFSMAKSIASTLVGIAIADGSITSLDDPVVRYVPELKGSAYDGVSVRQILTMSSGVRWDETYTDPKSDRRKVLELQLAGKPGEVLRYMGSLPRAAAPGSVWNYSTGETFVLGAVITGATHRSMTDYLSEKIWKPAGMESDATWWVDGPEGLAWAGSGLEATLRDFGRFALIAAANGSLNGRSLVPKGWFKEAGAPHEIGGRMIDYGYMWWIPPQSVPVHAGAFEAVGIFGQYMYINPRERLAIVVLSARPKPVDLSRDELADDAAFFAAVATALH